MNITHLIIINTINENSAVQAIVYEENMYVFVGKFRSLR